MNIALLHLEFKMPFNHSIKDKRRIVKSIKEKTKRKFNISVAELDRQDEIKYASLTFVCITNNFSNSNKVLTTVLNFIETSQEIEVQEYVIEER